MGAFPLPVHEQTNAMSRGWTIVLLTSLIGMGACVPPKVTVNSSPGFRPTTIRTLAVLPFQTLSTPQQFSSRPSQALVNPPEIRSQFQLPAASSERGQLTHSETRTVSNLAAKRITKMVYESLKHRVGVHLVPSFDVTTALTSYRSPDSTKNWKETVKEIGTRLEADAVVMGLVRTYRERVGTKIGATPAVVGFEVHLVDPLSGKIHWTGEYYEEQKPMNEDLMGFIERRGAFVTADELAQYGVRNIMQEFPVGGD
ncbi:MAG: hypothetical protein NPIRA05_06500 [Nitrospirales bacterium]|nr:MAG: hypothetical protein NPIRA05_06500 [Nitrospirales bacterium]